MVQVAAKVYNIVATATIHTYVPNVVHRDASGSGLTIRQPAGARRRLLSTPDPTTTSSQASPHSRRALLQSPSPLNASLTDLGLALAAALSATGVSTAALSPTDVDYTSAYLASLLAGVQYVQQATAQLGAASASVASSVATSYGDQALQQEAAADSALVAQLQALLGDAQAQLADLANRSAQVEAALDLQAAVFTQVFADAGGPRLPSHR